MNTINNQQTVDQQDLHDYYQSQIDALNQTIVQQNQYNEEYAKEHPEEAKKAREAERARKEAKKAKKAAKKKK